MIYMKTKKYLGVCLISFVLAIIFIGSVSALNFLNPSAGNNVSGTFNIAWNNSESMPGLYLQYKQTDNCSSIGGWTSVIPEPFPESITSYLWDTTGKNGNYCLRLVDAPIITDISSGIFLIDNTLPTAAVILNQAGKENDTANPNTITIINATYSDSGSGIASCTINWGDGNSANCPLSGNLANHQYNDNGNYQIKVNATDNAGNSNIVSLIAGVQNLNPWGLTLTTSSDLVQGYDITFIGNAVDVNADVPLSYSWTFGDGGSLLPVINASTVKHKYVNPGTYIVTMNVSDKDGGKNSITLNVIVKIVNMTLQNQEVIATHLLQYSFSTGAAGSTCTLVASTEDGISITQDGLGNNCQLSWTPRYNQTSTNGPAVAAIKIAKGANYNYYSLNITVYSWIINLAQGINLVSLPLVPSNTSYSNVLSSTKCNISTVWAYQYSSTSGKNEWSYKTVNSSCGWNVGTLQDVSPGYGYYIVMNKSDILKGMGNKMYNPTTYPYPPMVTLVLGWNLIGQYGLNHINKSDALANLIAGTYPTMFDKDGLPALTLDHQAGYWLFITGSNNQLYAPSEPAYNFI